MITSEDGEPTRLAGRPSDVATSPPTASAWSSPHDPPEEPADGHGGPDEAKAGHRSTVDSQGVGDRLVGHALVTVSVAMPVALPNAVPVVV